MLTNLVKMALNCVILNPEHKVKVQHHDKYSNSFNYSGLCLSEFVIKYYENGQQDKALNRGFPSVFRDYVAAEYLRGRDTFELQSIRRKFNKLIKDEYYKIKTQG